MEYVDNNAYEVKANPEAADYDTWDCCFIQFFSYGKPNQQHPERPTERVKLKINYTSLLHHVYQQTGRDLSVLPPRAWLDLSF